MTTAAHHRADAERKTWSSLQARAALKGWQLWRSDAADGPQRYFAGRFRQVCVLADLSEVDRWLERVGEPNGERSH